MFWQIGLGYLLLGKRLAPIQVSCCTVWLMLLLSIVLQLGCECSQLLQGYKLQALEL